MAAIAEPFASGDSFLHRMDPRIRLLSGAALTIPTAVLPRVEPAYLTLVLGLLLLVLARLNLRLVLKRLLAVNFFIAFLWLFLPFSLPGTPVWTVGPVAATEEGLALAFLVTIKSNAIVLTLMSLMATIPVQQLGPAIQKLGMPHKLTHIFLFTYRYIFVIHEEYQTMRTAMQARGFKPRTNSHTYRSYAWLVGMLLVKSWDRAERVRDAMRCRGFRGHFYTLAEFRTKPSDYVFFAGCLLLAARLVFLGFFQQEYT